jgi:maltose alpha-D-glucosyltransferase / alpha-amylase
MIRKPGSMNDPLWYKDAVIYEVRTRSFYDSNGDGIGDLEGLRAKLDYLADLGVSALWLLPHYPSPGRDDGYDCADYTDIHPDVGTLEDFDNLVAESHKRGIRIITELVLNHTSDQHPWFQRARRAPPGSPEREFYVWSDTADRYRDARIIFRDFEPSNWTWDPVAKAYFWHRFFSHQPDLNFENLAVHEAMFGVVDFWLARGVDGLRLDAVPYLYEAEGTNCENLPATHAFLKKLRAHVDAKFPNRMLLAEANQWPEDAAAYFGDGDECHMNFHFPIMPRLFMSIHMEDRFPIIDILKQTPELHPSCQWAMFLRNHDELTLEMVTDEERDYMYRAYAHEAQMRINLGIRRRLAPLVGNDRKKMELLNGLLFSMPGTPVLYYGDEIGMGDNVWLGDRNGVRTPMQWSSDRNAGFSRANPQRLILPINIDPEYHYEAINVEMQQSSSTSLLWWTKRLLALRKRYRAFGRGSVEFLHPLNPRVLAFLRRYESDGRHELLLVVANLSRHVQYVELDLSAMKGMIPVELMGRTRFPPIGDAPYLLTLGGHDFYWFALQMPRPTHDDRRVFMSGSFPIIGAPIACTSVDAVLFGDERPLLEEVMPAFLAGRGLSSGVVTGTKIVESFRLTDGEEPLSYVFVRVEYAEGEAESFAIPLVVGAEPHGAAHTVATLALPDGRTRVLSEATTEGAARALVELAAHARVASTQTSRLAGVLAPGSSLDPSALGEPRVLSIDRVGASIAYGTSAILKLLYRVEEGTAPELETARFLQQSAHTKPPSIPPPRTSGTSIVTVRTADDIPRIAPRVYGWVERRAPRSEPVTLALVEELVAHQGTGWQYTQTELGRMYDRVLAHPPESPLPEVPRASLLELARTDPPPEHGEAIGTYRDWAMLLGRKLADLHIALSTTNETAFEPMPYSTMDQRSKYQSSRNLVGRVLAMLRRTASELPPDMREHVRRVAEAEDAILARFEPILTERIDAKQIRTHGDFHLGKVLFTGKDFVIIGTAGGRDRRPSERRRRRGGWRDVASMIRSFDWAASVARARLRPEDEQRAEVWGAVWEAWATASFLRGYLDRAEGRAFLPRSSLFVPLLEAAIIEKAFHELRNEIIERRDRAMIPLLAIVRTLE